MARAKKLPAPIAAFAAAAAAAAGAITYVSLAFYASIVPLIALAFVLIRHGRR